MKRWLVTVLVAALALSACASPGATPHAEAVRIDPAAAGWNAAALGEVVSYVASQKSTGFVIIENNRIITEQLWPLPADAETFRSSFVHGTAADGALLEDVASQQKSFVAILAGVAIDKGLLDLSKPVSFYAGAGWSRATPEQEAAITVRNLMEMNSGLKENLTFDAAPDTKFFYNTPAYAIMKRVLEGASKLSLDDLTQAWLAKPAGMNDTAWRKRPRAFTDSGNPTGLVTTPRDIARMGQLVLDGGVAADGTRVISKAQLDALFVRTKTNPSYGHLWWLNGASETVNVGATSPRRVGQFITTAPADMVAAMGAQDRKLFVIPSRKLIVVRTGQGAPDRDFNEKLWELLTKAMPAR
jgi:CubicO group peptidase (beta-lactamase class C family)